MPCRKSLIPASRLCASFRLRVVTSLASPEDAIRLRTSPLARFARLSQTDCLSSRPRSMRGRAGRADAAFVNRLARRLKLVIEIDSANVPSIAKKTKASLETTARHARYAFFVVDRTPQTLSDGWRIKPTIRSRPFSSIYSVAAGARVSARCGAASGAIDCEHGTANRATTLGVWREEIVLSGNVSTQIPRCTPAQSRSRAAASIACDTKIIPLLEASTSAAANSGGASGERPV